MAPPPVETESEPDTDPDNPPPAPASPSLPNAFPPVPALAAPWAEPRRVAEGEGVEVVNRSDGGFFYWLLRYYAFGLLCGLGALFMTAVGVADAARASAAEHLVAKAAASTPWAGNVNTRGARQPSIPALD